MKYRIRNTKTFHANGMKGKKSRVSVKRGEGSEKEKELK